MPLLTVKIDDELRKRISRMKNVNWSEVVRNAIRLHLAKGEQRDLVKATLMNEKLRKRPVGRWDSVEVVRYWREHRYGRRR